MAIKAFFTTLLSFLLLASPALASIVSVCKLASSNPTVDYNFCVSSLSSARGGITADDQGLAVISGNLAVKQATTAKSKIDSLLKDLPDPRWKTPLGSCRELYDNAISTDTDAVNAARTKDYSNAKTWFSAGLKAPTTCEQGFQELHLPSPLSKEDSVLRQLTSIALSITVFLAGPMS